MVGQMLRWHPLARGRGLGGDATGRDRSPVRVAVSGDVATQERVRRLAAAVAGMTVVDGSSGDHAADVIVVTLDDHDPSGLDEVRRAARRPDRPRTVVIADGTGLFELAFDAGADVWVDTNAEDDTVVAAILAPLRSPSDA